MTRTTELNTPTLAERNDWLTVSAIGLMAMCIVTFDHEALGHGIVCFALHGHIRLVTSSLFRCDARSGWIDVGGPAMNLLIGLVALVVRSLIPPRFLKLRLLLIFIFAFSFFWEAGYLIQAMYQREGDLYSFTRFLLGSVAVWQRWLGAALGVALFVFGVRITSRELLVTWPNPGVARAVARTVWLSAALGATLAASTYAGHGLGNLRDAFMEIGAASFPLLVVPFGRAESMDIQHAPPIIRSYAAILFSLVLYALFTATMGRGIGT